MKIKCSKCNKVQDKTKFYKLYSGYTVKRCIKCVAKENKDKAD